MNSVLRAAASVEDVRHVVVRRQWNDYRTAVYRAEDVSDVRWDIQSGGVGAVSPQPFLYGYVRCDAALSGEVCGFREAWIVSPPDQSVHRR